MKPFRIHVGYTITGRNRWRYFATIQDAVAAANVVFVRTGSIIAVEASPKAKKHKRSM